MLPKAMTDLLIRNLSPELEKALREKAQSAKQSLSAVAQDLMRKGLIQPQPDGGLGTAIRTLIPSEHLGDLEIPRDAGNLPPPDFK
jgi:plasmid stability protein